MIVKIQQFQLSKSYYSSVIQIKLNLDSKMTVKIQQFQLSKNK